MKISINKKAKRVLSLIMAIAILATSLFVANVGVTFDVNAAAVEDTWDGTKVEPTTTDAAGNIIINTAEELAWIALQGGSATQGKNYKVVDNAVFNMNGMSGITMNSTAAEVKSATKNNDCLWINNSNIFMGNFDGNGLIVYNINGNGGASYAYVGLFTITKASTDSASTDMLVFKNVSVMASYFTGYHGVGGIIGQADAPGTGTKLTVENCAVKNCYLYNDSTGGSRAVAGIVGTLTHNGTTINNCSVINNDISSTGTYGAFFANTSNWGDIPVVSNSVVVGTSPVATKVGADFGSKVANTTYSNVYTDQTVSQTGVTKLTIAQMTGSDAVANMKLDFSINWFANTSGVPELRKFHNMSAIDNGDSTHNEVCVDCEKVGLASKHVYNNVDYTTSTSSCNCGSFIYGVSDVWDGTKATSFAGGTGTEADPYIIETAEQLFLMVRSTGLDAKGNNIYYKVSDRVNALYINDTRTYTDQAAFESAAANGALKNWSNGIITEAQYCAAKTAETGVTCSAGRHLDAAIDFFAGKFDGNGVTIYGLYSYTKDYSYYAPGVGFVPALTNGAVIKNVVFDTNYVKAEAYFGGYAGVVTSCLGSYYDGQYSQGKCEHVTAYARTAEKDGIANVMNVAVRNAYVETKDCPLVDGTQSFASGLVSSCFYPSDVNISNCLFDGTNSTFKLTGSSGITSEAGILATRSATNFVCVSDCVVVEGNNTPSQVITHPTYTGSNNTYECSFKNYSLAKDDFTPEKAPMLNWTAWDIDASEEYGVPMPKTTPLWVADSLEFDHYNYASKYKLFAITGDNVYDGWYYGAMRPNNGVFNAYNTLEGSGTEADPYIIDDALTLYRIIASGGIRYGVPQHYKLACNIDLNSLQWVDTETFANEDQEAFYYSYVPFAGTIDGDGHTITGMNTARNNENVGFIPELKSTAVVKNINFRNCYAYSNGGLAGIVAGSSEAGAKVENCSIEGSVVTNFIGDTNATVNYSYATDAEGNTAYVGGTAPTLDGINWYGIVGGVVRPVSFAKSQPCADIDGDGIGEEYTASDITALKNNLLWAEGYDYIYGDVTGNGKTDMRDLAALQREITGQEVSVLDGFWANVKAGKFAIYYDENDNYDFARKLELYFERVTQTDITKTLGNTNANFTINIKTEGTENAYSVTYDAANAKLVIKGGSFTAIEEAVEKIVASSDVNAITNNSISGTISSEKNAITVDGNKYYYAWGDEFNEGVAGTVSYDKWTLRNKGTDSTPGEVDTEFEYIRKATDDEARLINQVKDGKLTLKRGFTGLTGANDHKFYMSGVGTRESMLFKQGYLEMVAAVPSDGYAFPAWWLLTSNEHRSNYMLDSSLFSKVYDLNENYDGTTANPTGSNVQSFKYKLPTQTLEMDLFEIIQRPTSYSSSFFNPSSDHNIKFNIHKWYVYSLDRTDDNLTVYNLDWNNAPASGAFPTKLLTATGSEGQNYTQQTASIKINANNLKDGSVNGAATYQGSHSEMKYDMKNLRSNGQITARKYGFLWTEDEMTFYVYNGTDANASVIYSATVTASQMNFGGESDYNNDNYGFGQYAYMLIENHIFTAQKNGSKWYQANYSNVEDCDLVIDYVRIYQLDNHRAIITPESEALRDR